MTWNKFSAGERKKTGFFITPNFHNAFLGMKLINCIENYCSEIELTDRLIVLVFMTFGSLELNN